MNISEDEFDVYDTETTGLDTSEARIVEIGLVKFTGGKMKSRGRKLFNPGIDIPKEASEVHRVTDEMVKDKAPFSDYASKVMSGFEKSNLIVGYNCLRYDNPLMDAEFVRSGVTDWEMPEHKTLDVLVFVNWFHRGERPRTQVAIGEKYGVLPKGGQAHSAAVDCQMTGELLLAMVKKGLIPDDLGEALALQEKIFPIIEKEFEDYGVWFYKHRETGRLHFGAGGSCGKAIATMKPGSVSWHLREVKDFTPKAYEVMMMIKESRTIEEVQTTIPNPKEDEQDATTEETINNWGG